MLSPETEVFFQSPDETTRRVLHAATVRSIEDNAVTAVCEAPRFEVHPGDDMLLYYETRREFMKQPIRIEAVMESEDHQLTVVFDTVGQAVSAESRQCYRVSTVMGNQTAVIGDEADCPLLDVSPTGFAVVVRGEHLIGAVLDVALEQDGKTFTGQAAVQSMRMLADGRTRYGFFCSNDRRTPSDLADGLAKISSAAQREHLRRRSGAA